MQTDRHIDKQHSHKEREKERRSKHT
uniref:Uncharacterized protein n=1 Tax=Anguilla anguilla TaxID=7936 RepID=A0A0E9Q232_ANGAN